jgi:transcriptional regulator GlxA family with amidase domain
MTAEVLLFDGFEELDAMRALDDLRAHGGIEVLDARVVDDGDVLTAGAPACGLDLALRLLERADGPELAEAAARTLGYERPAVEVG